MICRKWSVVYANRCRLNRKVIRVMSLSKALNYKSWPSVLLQVTQAKIDPKSVIVKREQHGSIPGRSADEGTDSLSEYIIPQNICSN